MNLKDLKYLVALAEHRHFGRAADACFVSQPTLSAQIKKLETFLGAPLVERAPRNVSLTALGENVVARAKSIVADVDELIDAARQGSSPLAGELSLGLIPTVGPYLLPKVVGNIANELPDLNLKLVEAQTAVLVEQLQGGSIDCALLALPVEPSSLETLPLYSEDFVFATAAANQVELPAQLTDLPASQLILLDEGHCLRDQALDVCKQSNTAENAMYRATSLETLRHMVALGQGDTLLPSLAVSANDGIRSVAFQVPAPHRRLGLVFRSSSVKRVAIAALGNAITTALSDARGIELIS